MGKASCHPVNGCGSSFPANEMSLSVEFPDIAGLNKVPERHSSLAWLLQISGPAELKCSGEFFLAYILSRKGWRTLHHPV